ncbi:MAG: acyl carrier protein [Pseudomonadota bacterium]
MSVQDSLTTADTRTALRTFILENYLFTDDDAELADDDSFLDRGILDSMGILELTEFLKDQFGVKVEDDEMTPDNLDSIGNLLKYLEQKSSDA